MEYFQFANAPQLNDMRFTQNVTSPLHPVRSLLDCLRHCVAVADRKAFTYVRGSAGSPPPPPQGGLCQGYSKRKAAGDAHVALPHAMTFVLPVPPPIPDWISTSCVSRADCVNKIPESDLYQSSQLPICYKQLCLCSIGYFYSVSQKLCVSSCPSQLQPTYRLYPGSGLNYNNDYTYSGSLSYCQEKCSALPDCQNFERNNDSKECHCARVSDSNKFLTSDEPWNYYQRDCA